MDVIPCNVRKLPWKFLCIKFPKGRNLYIYINFNLFNTNLKYDFAP